MQEILRIADQLKRAYEGEAWHGPSLKEILNGVTAEVAVKKPLPSSHCIWELVRHIAVWEGAARRRISGDPAIISDEQDWSATTDRSDQAWSDELAALERGHMALREAVAKLTDADLERKAEGQKYSIYFLLHGVIQHDLYHAGQIAILKRSLM
jgi:uncharacterized damage-inducible protein DinB